MWNLLRRLLMRLHLLLYMLLMLLLLLLLLLQRGHSSISPRRRGCGRLRSDGLRCLPAGVSVWPRGAAAADGRRRPPELRLQHGRHVELVEPP